MNRITRDQLYIEVANLFAKRSTCFRQNIGAVIVHDNHIIAHGYNGSPPGAPHCAGQSCPLTIHGGCSRSIHAEINALNYCPPDIAPLTLYVTQSPCENCAIALAATRRFDKVFYNSEYRLRTGIDYLLRHDIKVFRITQSGYVINSENNTLCQN